MSAIAYITDSKMLEMHRLNANKTMNFWRLSNKLNFSDFKVGDLVFFLSKDKEYMSSKKEKGIVGYGRLASIYLNSPKTMWDKFNKQNGYKTYEEFKEAIIKVSKDHKLPKKISSFYLENVNFFQVPIYLSEFDMSISKNAESYVYIKPDEAVIKLLDYASNTRDLWSSNEEDTNKIEKIRYCLYLTHKQIGDIPLSDNKKKIAKRNMNKYLLTHNKYSYIQDSNTECYLINENNLEIIFFHNKDIDIRTIIGQSELYRYYLNKYYGEELNISFRTTDNSIKDYLRK